MASYTINFADGSSHTYDNVPEGVTEDQVRARAGDEYGDKEISSIAAAQPPAPAPAASWPWCDRSAASRRWRP